MEIIAHRGLCRSKEEENSIKAFMQAVVMKCPMLELDVQRTMDNHLIVSHDSHLAIKGHHIIVGNHSLSDLLEAGYVVDRYSENQLHTQTIPTLRLVLELFLSQIKINIEIKGCSGGRCLAETISRMVGNKQLSHGLLEKITVSSFWLGELQDFREYYRNIPTGYLTSTIFSKGSRKGLINTLKEFHINAIHLSKSIVDEEMVADFKNAGLLVRVYTVNNINELYSLEQFEVDGIFTDCAGEFMGVVGGLPISSVAVL